MPESSPPPTSTPPPPPSFQISSKWDAIIVDSLTTTAIATAACGTLGMILFKNGGGYRVGSVMAGVGFGVGNAGFKVWDMKK
ncbi:hypothetical protein TrVE_jg10683 [Triparma verrucosa]|uniref:Uncharacterized protein n=2 Tax=Triparma TaxID=722752 RepID=A0A9W7BU22_9STRA|nr:hypothetical protein TrVE_jg10683 [Triparma verrucosa]GMH96486.1 hypothetical protein TrST_g12590 [Triparma strigata]